MGVGEVPYWPSQPDPAPRSPGAQPAFVELSQYMPSVCTIQLHKPYLIPFETHRQRILQHR
jgi:hypothetical protein